MPELVMSEFSRFQEIEEIGVGRKPLRWRKVVPSLHRPEDQGTALPVLIQEAGELLKVVLAGGRVCHSDRTRVLSNLPAQINERRNNADGAEDFRNYSDLRPGHDSLRL